MRRHDDRRGNPDRDLGEWLHHALHRFRVLDDYWWTIKYVAWLALFLVIFMASAFELNPDAGLSPYLLVFLAFAMLVAVSGGYMLLKGDQDAIEAISPDFEPYRAPAGDRFPRTLDRLNDDAYDGKGSLVLGALAGSAFLLLASCIVGYPFDWDGWLDAMLGGASIAFRIVGIVFILVACLLGARLHGSRTCAGFSVPLAGAAIAFQSWWLLG